MVEKETSIKRKKTANFTQVSSISSISLIADLINGAGKRTKMGSIPIPTDGLSISFWHLLGDNGEHVFGISLNKKDFLKLGWYAKRNVEKEIEWLPKNTMQNTCYGEIKFNPDENKKLTDLLNDFGSNLVKTKGPHTKIESLI